MPPNNSDENSFEESGIGGSISEENTNEENIPDEEFPEDFDEELQEAQDESEIPENSESSPPETLNELHNIIHNADLSSVDGPLLETANTMPLTPPLYHGARRGRKRGKGRGRPPYKSHSNRYIPRGRVGYTGIGSSQQRGRYSGWRGRPPTRYTQPRITHTMPAQEQLQTDSNATSNTPYTPVSSFSYPQNGSADDSNTISNNQKNVVKPLKLPKKKISNGDFLKFSTLWLIPGKPRKWRSVWKTIGPVKLRTWEVIDDTSDPTFVNMQNVLASGVNTAGRFRKSSRTIRAATNN